MRNGWGWAVSQRETLPIDKWPRVTQVLSETGICDFSKIPNAEFYLERGAEVHLICESMDRGEPDWWSDGELAGYAAAWAKFKEESGFVPTLIEYPVYNEKRMYKGTLDRTGKLGKDGPLVLLDIKSGIVGDWVALPTAAYAACLEDAASIRRFGLQLKGDGSYVAAPEFKNFTQDSNYFFALLAAVHARGLYGKTIVEAA